MDEKSASAAAAAAGLLFLPGEIIIDILSRLPVDSVIQCKRVCKTWRSLVDHDPTFLAMHTHRFMMIKSVPAAAAAAAPCCFFLYVNKSDDGLSRLSTYRLHFLEYLEDENNNNNANVKVKLSDKPALEKHYPASIHHDRKIILSCNGLILIASSFSTHCDNMMVFNPVTKEYVDLPPSGEEQEEFIESDQGKIIPLIKHGTSTGFGYHPITKEYKIVRIKYLPNFRNNVDEEDHRGYIYVYIYTLGKSSWSSRREIKAENNPSSCFWVGHLGVHLNGVVHWTTAMSKILLFDLADEEFKILPIPLPPMTTPPGFIFTNTSIISCRNVALGVLGGCLCCYRRIVTDFTTTEIWVLLKHKEEAGDEDEEMNSDAANSCSWIKKFSSPSICEEDSFVPAIESNKILFLRFYHEHFHFVSYDPETGNIYGRDEGKCFLDPLDRWSAIIPYVKSFVSLKALGEEDAKYMCC